MERRSDYFIKKVAHKTKFFISEGKRLFSVFGAEYVTEDFIRSRERVIVKTTKNCLTI